MLSDGEKKAGKAFRDKCQQMLEQSHEDSPPTYVPPPWIRNYRHNCALRQGRSTALSLQEKYWTSPELWVCYCGVVQEQGEDFPHFDCDGGVLAAEAGRFAFIFKEGKCGCRETARSKAGRLVDAYTRPPLSGRVARN